MIGTMATADPMQPLAPIGKWVLNGRSDDLTCVLARDFGDPAHPIGFAISPGLTGHTTVAVSFEAEGGRKYPERTGEVTLLPAKLVLSGDRSAKFNVATGRETLGFSLKPADGRALLTGLPNASAIAFEVGAHSFLFSTDATKSAAAVLAACRTQIARTLAIDPAALIQAPGMQLIGWVKAEDYPSADWKALAGNRAISVLTIDAKGKPTACRTATSSGRPIWDEATCTALLRRGKYRADAAGYRYAIVRVSWMEVLSRRIVIVEDTF